MDKFRELFNSETGLIDEYGWCARAVGNRVGETGPTFVYSMGFYRKNQPDVIIYGLPFVTSHSLLSILYRKISDGQNLKAGDVYHDVASGLPFALREYVGGRENVTGIYAHAYADKYLRPSVLAGVWPDQEGKFPWDPDFNQEFEKSQPREKWR